MIFDEEMEEVHQQETTNKRAKPYEATGVSAMSEVEVRSFPNGAPIRI